MVYDFGMRLQRARKQKGLTQKQVADKLDLNRRTIMSYENNSISPSLEIFKRLTIIYGVSSDYLLGLEHTNITPTQLDEIEKGIQQLQDYIRDMRNQNGS